MGRVALRGMRRHSDADSLWLITFADLMVQLMAYFALLYSFSAGGGDEREQVRKVLESLKKAFGVQAATQAGPLPGGGETPLPGQTGILPETAADLERLVSELKVTEGPEAGTRLRVVSFRGSLIFDEGSATLSQGSKVLLDRISELSSQYAGFTLVCEGHAAPKERGPHGADALELSGLRSQAALRYLASKGLPITILGAEAKGDWDLDGDPGSPEGRALQRRVVFRFQRVATR